MRIENAVLETAGEEEKQEKQQEQKSESPSISRGLALQAILMKKGEYTLSNSIVLPSSNLCLIGEEDTVLVPLENVLPILGVGNKDIKCSKCGYVLAMKIGRPQLQNLAIKCPSCGTLTHL